MKRNTLRREKEVLDKRFTAISKLMDSFAHAHQDFRGEQSMFISSGSEDDDYPTNKEGRDCNDDSEILSKSCNPNFTISGRVSSCPYPSAAEEKSLHKVNPPSSYGCSTSEVGDVPAKKKQKSKICTSVKNSGIQQKNGDGGKHISDDVLRSFVTFWKEACREHYVYEVLEKMFQFYEVSSQQKKKLKSLFSSYPCLLLLNVAVTSIKNGMWDSIYDAFQESSQQGICDPDADNASKFEIIEIDVGDKDPYFQRSQENVRSVTVEDLMSKICLYYEQGHCVQLEEKSGDENQFILLRNFSHFQGWLAEQFSVKDFKELGHGEIYTFMEKYASFFPKELHQLLTGDYFQQFPVEVCMTQQQLTVFLSQVSRSIWEDKDTIKKKITLLLSRQFPLPCFKIKKLGVGSCITNFSEKSTHVVSSAVLFSTAIIGFHGSEKSFGEKIRPEVSNVITGDCQKTRLNAVVTSKDAIKVLCKAPMLSDLMSWSHWDLIFTPVLGSLVQWLSKEVSATTLQSLVTKDGKIIRIDNNASVDSFFEAALQGSSYQTAVQLLSLFSLSGGVENVPFALLRNHASHIFKVIFKNHMEKVEEKTGISSDIRTCQRSVLKNEMAAASLSRFFIEILKYLPSEFRALSADVLLPGLKAVIRGAGSVVLSECKSTEERIMIHDVGISLDIVDWIDDFHAFTSASDHSSVTSSIYCSDSPSKIRNNEFFSELGSIKYTHSNPTFFKNVEICDTMNVASEAHIKVDARGLTDNEIYSDSAHLIESIRHEEFGLDPTHSASHNAMLEKQHARLGRALQCLSQELYSQDSHFLLELVQNADDNIYPDDVERTLGFILQDSGIVVLNNERGFSAQNIRALCDVGSSTKKGSGAGYIGHKGIGFKSVFRVTDAPEIHSNGYNFKFDISEGQIGFVLPSVVPSVDIKYLVNLIHDRQNGEMTIMNNTWNTCIVLPFKPMSSTTHAVNNIISMFLDLHPSLLLFLHRLQCIRFRNMISNSYVVMRKEVLDDGIIKVSRGEEKMTWLVVSKILQNTTLRPEVEMTEISIAFTLDLTEDGNYIPNLNKQPVFAFLPLRNYGMKFILQGDFVLPSSREEVDANSPWNQWLLSEFPALFITAERAFCSLPFFRGCLGKAVTTYVSYIPLVSEVHGFFSSLPHMIISKLRLSNCMILEGEEKWVPPCKVVRNWDENAYNILPPKLLYEHLGLGFLDKDVVLTDHVANALGIENYGPRILVQFLESLCSTVNGFSSLGNLWLCSWISTLYAVMLAYEQRQTFFSTDFDYDDIISSLRKIPFIPLSDGTYGSADSDKIWYCGDSGTSQDDCGLEYFPNFASKLRIVEPSLFVVAKNCSASSDTCGDHIIRIIQKIGVQQLTAHDILKVHVLPMFSANIHIGGDVDLIIEYLTFTMFHLQSGCSLCHCEGRSVIYNLQKNVLILTNYGSIRITEAPIHFGTEYGNCVNVDNFSCLKKQKWKWHVVDTAYLKHPINKLLKSPQSSWRNFFKDIGVTDFVQVVQVEKNIADLPTHFVKNIMGNDLLISHDLVVNDWESSELTYLLSSISLSNASDESKLLLAILDKLWDDCFDNKVLGYCKLQSDGDVRHFRSSFINDICNIRWVASIIDRELHYPKDLFYECDEVSSVLGKYAPYTIHQVQNLKLVNDMGFKTRVCMNDALTIIDLWRTSEIPFKASTAQMSKFYSFIWKEITFLKDKIPPGLSSGPFIFIPLEFGFPRDEVVSGLFASADQVFWRDSTGSMDKIKCSRQNALDFPLNKTLHHIYPDIHDFFVIECGVKETPSFHGYVEFLLQLSTLTLPSQAKDVVSDIVCNLADEVDLGLVDSENISYLKKSIEDAEFKIFPTVLDRWVSLHPKFGLVCWADSNDLKKEFKHMDNVDFLDICEPNDQMISSDTKFVNLMKLLAIPILSEIVTRVAIYNRITDSDYKTSIVNCCLPYAQRYIYSLHPERYSQLENLECDVVDGLQVVVVEQLHYRNVINRHGITSNKKFECASLLQDKILYTTDNCDLHTLFLELSKLFFPKPELYLANFLHMITTMLESGSSEEQTEFFILNSQRVPKLPLSKTVWSIPCNPHDQTTPTSCTASHPKPKRRPGINFNWPPVDWKTVPGFGSDVSNQFRTYPNTLPHFNTTHSPTPHYPLHPCPGLEKRNSDSENVSCPPESSTAAITESPNFTSSAVAYPSDISGKEEFVVEEQLTFGSNVSKHAVITGRIGEMLAFEYFSSYCEGKGVRWVNSGAETGLPYDIIIGNGETGIEYVEVKSTKSVKKNWFIITAREWQFAMEKGDSFSIAHILLSSSNSVLKIRILKNPAMLIQQGMLKMIIIMPSQKEDDNNSHLMEMNDQQQNIQLHVSY